MYSYLLWMAAVLSFLYERKALVTLWKSSLRDLHELSKET